MNTFPPNKDHGKTGRIKVVSEWNADRDPPSRQVWVELYWKRRRVGTSSANLVESLGRVDLDTPFPGDIPDDYEELTDEENKFVEFVAEKYEGASE